MNIAVLGSGGRTGRKVVEQARGRGHVVQGLQRSALEGDIAGDATDPARLRELVAGKDAVIVTLGPSATGPEDTCSRATEALVGVMSAWSSRAAWTGPWFGPRGWRTDPLSRLASAGTAGSGLSPRSRATRSRPCSWTQPRDGGRSRG